MFQLYPSLFFIFIIITLSVVLPVLIIAIKLRGKWPYVKVESLLTPAEHKFFFVLKQVLGDQYLLFSKVRLLDVLRLPEGMGGSDFQSYRNRIQSKHVDFLICDRQNVSPLLIVELDDSSHLRTKVMTRDMFVDRICEQAQLPILHVKVSADYNSADLLNKITEQLS